MLDYNAYATEVILRGGYELSEMEGRIDRLWMDGKITTEQRDALMPMAAERADNASQVDVAERVMELEHAAADLDERLKALEALHPEAAQEDEGDGEEYVVWHSTYQTKKGEIVLYDVTGDGQLDRCLYNGGRSYTAVGVGKIAGWYLVDDEGTPTHTITKKDGSFVLTEIETTEETEA